MLPQLFPSFFVSILSSLSLRRFALSLSLYLSPSLGHGSSSIPCLSISYLTYSIPHVRAPIRPNPVLCLYCTMQPPSTPYLRQRMLTRTLPLVNE